MRLWEDRKEFDQKTTSSPRLPGGPEQHLQSPSTEDLTGPCLPWVLPALLNQCSVSSSENMKVSSFSLDLQLRPGGGDLLVLLLNPKLLEFRVRTFRSRLSSMWWTSWTLCWTRRWSTKSEGSGEEVGYADQSGPGHGTQLEDRGDTLEP